LSAREGDYSDSQEGEEEGAGEEEEEDKIGR
jgi:hypothetical protein